MLYLPIVLAASSFTAPVSLNALQPSRVTMSRISMQAEIQQGGDLSSAAATPAPFTATSSGWSLDDVTPDGALAQRVEGSSRRTWKFNDISTDRVQVAAESEGRPINAKFQLWIGPDWTPFTLDAYTEDGALRPIQSLIGTRNKQAMIEVTNNGESEFPFTVGANYANKNNARDMAVIPEELPANTNGMKCDGGALKSFTVDPETQQLEVVLRTDGRQLNARIEVLAGPNNPKQTYQVMTQNGALNCLAVSMNLPDAANTVRIVNMATVEFPCYIHFREIA